MRPGVGPKEIPLEEVRAPSGLPRDLITYQASRIRADRVGGKVQFRALMAGPARSLGQQVSRLGRPFARPRPATGCNRTRFLPSARGARVFRRARNRRDEWWDFDIPADRYPGPNR